MISFLEGTVEFKGERFVVVNVSGVGYKVFASQETLRKIPEKTGKVNNSAPLTVKIWTHQHVREDALDLYGFLHFSELEFFETLLTISGIGPKGALGILSLASVDTIKKAIAAGDTSYLTRVSGIGRKMAEKIVLELKDKFAGKGGTVEAPELQEEADAMDALVALGYREREAREALAKMPSGVNNVGMRVKAALKQLGKKQ